MRGGLRLTNPGSKRVACLGRTGLDMRNLWIVKRLLFHFVLAALLATATRARAQEVVELDRGGNPADNRALVLNDAAAWFDPTKLLLGEATTNLTVAGWVR